MLSCVFQPALPMRGVTVTQNKDDIAGLFQPALPMRGVTKLTRYSRAEDVFQPALPMRGVTLRALMALLALAYFNPHSPCGE